MRFSVVDFKKNIGKTVFAIPTGEFARHCEKDTVLPAQVVKVGRVNVTLSLQGREKVCRMHEVYFNRVFVDGANGGYKIFTTEEVARNHIEAKAFRVALREAIGDLSDAELLMIKKSLKK
jgi:hypothetical protein